MTLSAQTKPDPVFFASNLDASLDAGISNSTGEYLRRMVAREHELGREVAVLRVGYGWGRGRVGELIRLRQTLASALRAGATLTVEGYKAALFCLSIRRLIRRAPVDRVSFIIHDAGSQSHLRIAKFWARRGNLRTFYRLYRAALDWLIEGLVLRGRRVFVVSTAEAAKVRFTRLVEVLPPSGMRAEAARVDAAVPVSPADSGKVSYIVLYADLRVPHLLQSALDNLRTLAGAGVRSHHRLLVLGRRALPAKLHVLAGRVFTGGVVDSQFAPNLAETLANSDAVWLPDLVGSGVKNRTLDALRFSSHVIATDFALEGIDLTAPESGFVAHRVDCYRHPSELGALLS